MLGGIREGNRLPTVPKFQMAASATYGSRFGDNADWYVSGSFQHVGNRYTQPGDQEEANEIFNFLFYDRETGIFGSSSAPAQMRRDYVSNSNDSYWLTNSRHLLTGPGSGYSPLYGPVGVPQHLRTRLSFVQLDERLAFLNAVTVFDEHGGDAVAHAGAAVAPRTCWAESSRTFRRPS